MRLPRSVSSPSRRVTLLTIFVLSSILIFTQTRNSYSSSFALYGNGEHIVDVRAILTAVPEDQENVAWNDDSASTQGLYTVGSPATSIELDDTGIIDMRTGEPIQDVNEGSTFNLAVLKLPHGSKWAFVGVARGPTRQRDFMSLKGHPSREQVLIAFGLNITTEGKLFAVTPGQTLDFPMIPTQGCLGAGPWVATYGAEDPRLFWTDAGTPALTFARSADAIDLCRSVGLVTDLRELFPDLAEALRTGVEGVKAYDGYKEPGEGTNREMVRKEDQGVIEKNWMPFYPQAVPDSTSLFPHIHYHLLPDIVLEPVEVKPRQVIYSQVPSDSDLSSCIAKHYPKYATNHKIHQASPLYRLTLCNRGCLATDQNTVNIALSHTQTPTRRYGRFIAATNVTYPFEPISVGPQFLLNGCDDSNDINYALTLAPLQASDLDPFDHRPIPTPQDVLPNHFFLDDMMLITLGHNDKRMISVLTTVKEVLGRQKMCG
ncbi:hypothetical protein I317_01649 [Kwoniella heveanensis CBS 569]|nr:hypothetical protein I317_01649 [Kwoniella heveanensis CBS 569]